MNINNPIPVHPDASVRKRFAERLGVTDLFYPDNRIKALGDREGFSVLNLAQNLQTHAEQHRVFCTGSSRIPATDIGKNTGIVLSEKPLLKESAETLRPKSGIIVVKSLVANRSLTSR
jgi:hypothetical protein